MPVCANYTELCLLYLSFFQAQPLTHCQEASSSGSLPLSSLLCKRVITASCRHNSTWESCFKRGDTYPATGGEAERKAEQDKREAERKAEQDKREAERNARLEKFVADMDKREALRLAAQDKRDAERKAEQDKRDAERKAEQDKRDAERTAEQDRRISEVKLFVSEQATGTNRMLLCVLIGSILSVLTPVSLYIGQAVLGEKTEKPAQTAPDRKAPTDPAGAASNEHNALPENDQTIADMPFTRRCSIRPHKGWDPLKL